MCQTKSSDVMVDGFTPKMFHIYQITIKSTAQIFVNGYNVNRNIVTTNGSSETVA